MKYLVGYFIFFIAFSFISFAQYPSCGFTVRALPVCQADPTNCFYKLIIDDPNHLLPSYSQCPNNTCNYFRIYPQGSTTPVALLESDIRYNADGVSWCGPPLPVILGNYVLRIINPNIVQTLPNQNMICESNVFTFAFGTVIPSLLFRKNIGTATNLIPPLSNDYIGTCFGGNVFLDIRKSENMYNYDLSFTRVDANGNPLAGYSPITIHNFSYLPGTLPTPSLTAANTSGVFQIRPNAALDALFTGTPMTKKYIKVDISYSDCQTFPGNSSAIFTFDIGCQEVMPTSPVKMTRK